VVKYWFTYKGIANDTFLVEILDESFEDESIEINGYVSHDYITRKDLLQPIISSSLDISLEANKDLTLQDLYTEEESKFKVRLTRNDQVIFYGILKPDGIWQDFVNTNWQISMDAMDGLSTLKDLSFIKDPTDFDISLFYVGQITQFEAVKQCLHRIGYDLPINVSIDLPKYIGFDSLDTILKSVLINADRFYQDAEKDNIMDCEEVLKSVLEIYNATIIQMNGEWWIYRTIDVADTMYFLRYDGEERTGVVWDSVLQIGSHIDNFEVFHAKANQKVSINPSTQAFRVNYKYGTVRTIAENSDLEFNGTDITGWTFYDLGGRVSPQDDDTGLKVSGDFYTPITNNLVVSSNQSINVTEGDGLSVVFYNNYVRTHYLMFPLILAYRIETANFILNDSGWIGKPGNEGTVVEKTYSADSGAFSETFNLPLIPEDGDLSISLFVRVLHNATDTALPPPTPLLFIDGISVVPNETSNLKGEFHTAQRLTRISTVTKSDKVVNNGDSVSDIFYGTLYKENGDPTEFWNRVGNEMPKPLLQIMVEDTLRISPRPMYFFEGDVCGYFPYLSKISINNFTGKYQISKYSYDTKTNINSTNFKEYDNAELIRDIDYRYEFQPDYGNVTKVTIVG